MTSLKRQAQPLLPTRNPKQPRLALTGYSGAPASPSETEGIASRWLALLCEAGTLVSDTAAVMLPIRFKFGSEDDDSDTAVEPQSPGLDSSSPSPNSTPRQPSATLNSKTPSVSRTYPIPPPRLYDSQNPPTWNTRNGTSSEAVAEQLPENIPLPPSPIRSKLDDRQSSYPPAPTFRPDVFGQSTPRNNMSPYDSFLSTIPNQTPRYSSTDSMSQSSVVSDMRNLHLENTVPPSAAASSQTSEDSSCLSDSMKDTGSQTSRRSSQSSKRAPLLRNAQQRKHIFDKLHRAKVAQSRQQLRDEMLSEIYELKRKKGFKSRKEDLKGLLNYERQLKGIDLGKEPPPLRGSELYRAGQRERQVVLESYDNFLQNALEKAKATLQSPKPAKAFPVDEHRQILLRAKDEEIERRIRPPKVPLPKKLPPDDEKKVDEVLRSRGFISKFAREQVSHSDLTRLLPGQWLNDEIINFYGAMLLGRSENCKENPAPVNGKKGKKAPLSIHYFTSFLWTKLVNEGYEKGRLAKWTKKIDIFSKDIVFMPVNHGNAHWTAAAINFRAKRFESYDSMGMAKGVVFRRLREYVKAEHQNKKKKDFDFTGWEDWAPESTPQQENGFDCGVFTCQFMEALSRGEEFGFTQEDMPYLRRRMIWEIAHAKLRDDR